MKKYYILPLLLAFLGIVIHSSIHTHIVSASPLCTVTVDPTTVTTYSQTNFVFTITNTGESAIESIRVTKPSDNFSGDMDGLYQITIAPSEEAQISGTSVTYGSEAPAASWTITASENADGSDPTTCSGDVSVKIEGQGEDTFPPSIGIAQVSNADATSLTVTWTTDEVTTAILSYGLTSAYGSQISSSTLSKSHTFSLTGLSPSTTYHLNVTFTDASSNSMEIGDSTFYTAKAGVTIVTQQTTEVTKIVTPSPSPTPIPDTRAPIITINTAFEGVYPESPVIEGNVRDDTDIESIEYSLDNGISWATYSGWEYGSKETTFQISLPKLDDGNYDFLLRANDSSDNRRVSDLRILIIDRLPPRVGGVALSVGSLLVAPDINGYYNIPVGVTVNLYTMAVGGATSLAVISDGDEIPFWKYQESNTWATSYTCTAPGLHTLIAKSIDGAQNQTSREIATINCTKAGTVVIEDKPIAQAKVSVYVFDEKTKQFSLWNARYLSQENPQLTNDNGEYSLLLPKGKYYIAVEAGGRKSVQTEIFTLDRNTSINMPFSLPSIDTFSMNPFVLPYIDFPKYIIPFIPNSNEIVATTSPLTEFPQVSLPGFSNSQLYGKLSVVTVMSLWHPDTIPQMEILEDLSKSGAVQSIPIITQTTPGSASVLTKRGNYSIPVLADPDGELLDPLKITSYPTHYFVNRKGVVVGMRTGLLDIDSLIDNVMK